MLSCYFSNLLKDLNQKENNITRWIAVRSVSPSDIRQKTYIPFEYSGNIAARKAEDLGSILYLLFHYHYAAISLMSIVFEARNKMKEKFDMIEIKIIFFFTQKLLQI